MFKYKTSQKVYEIDGLKIGGNSFEIPPVLMASIFIMAIRYLLMSRRVCLIKIQPYN
jgi:tetrahydromethanopterin S-methyltransferase subunit H